MFFDLNNKSFDSIVFNNANTGKVENVKMSVELREPGTNQPHIKLVFEEATGSKVNSGIYINDKDPNVSEEDYNKYLRTRVVNRLLEAALAVVPEDHVFPPVQTFEETKNILLDAITQFAPNQPVNVFVTYGTKERPSKYLSPRFFNFVEKAGTPVNKSKLVPAGGDNNEKFIEPTSDQDISNSMNFSGGTPSYPKQNEGMSF